MTLEELDNEIRAAAYYKIDLPDFNVINFPDLIWSANNCYQRAEEGLYPEAGHLDGFKKLWKHPEANVRFKVVAFYVYCLSDTWLNHFAFDQDGNIDCKNSSSEYL